MFEDKTLKCKDCGDQFIFTTGEQEFYAQKGFQNEPARCAPCRRARKMDKAAGRMANDRISSTISHSSLSIRRTRPTCLTRRTDG